MPGCPFDLPERPVPHKTAHYQSIPVTLSHAAQCRRPGVGTNNDEQRHFQGSSIAATSSSSSSMQTFSKQRQKKKARPSSLCDPIQENSTSGNNVLNRNSLMRSSQPKLQRPTTLFQSAESRTQQQSQGHQLLRPGPSLQQPQQQRRRPRPHRRQRRRIPPAAADPAQHQLRRGRHIHNNNQVHHNNPGARSGQRALPPRRGGVTDRARARRYAVAAAPPCAIG